MAWDRPPAKAIDTETSHHMNAYTRDEKPSIGEIMSHDIEDCIKTPVVEFLER